MKEKGGKAFATSLLPSHLPVPRSLSLGLLQLARGHEWAISKKQILTSAAFTLHLYCFILITPCLFIVQKFSQVTSVIHDQSLCSAWVHVLSLLRLNTGECSIKPYTEQKDQRLLNPTVTHPQRRLSIFLQQPLCPHSGPQAKTMTSALLSDTVKYSHRPQKTFNVTTLEVSLPSVLLLFLPVRNPEIMFYFLCI